MRPIAPPPRKEKDSGGSSGQLILIIVLMIVLLILSCDGGYRPVIPVKPLYVIDKGFGGYTRSDCWFEVIDSKGQRIIFEDECKWTVGDTIK